MASSRIIWTRSSKSLKALGYLLTSVMNIRFWIMRAVLDLFKEQQAFYMLIAINISSAYHHPFLIQRIPSSMRWILIRLFSILLQRKTRKMSRARIIKRLAWNAKDALLGFSIFSIHHQSKAFWKADAAVLYISVLLGESDGACGRVVCFHHYFKVFVPFGIF